MFWDNPVPLAAWITIFWVIIILGVLFGTLGYAEEEFWTVSLDVHVQNLTRAVLPQDPRYSHLRFRRHRLRLWRRTLLG